MKEQKLIILITPEGKITADASGFSGDTCIQELEKLLEDLAPGKVSVERKPDTGKSLINQTKRQDLGRNS
jgi:Protein of unknown function (DUF2997)